MIAKAEFEARAPFKMIETRIWSDEKFVKLSRVKPSGQSLFLYLLSGPHTLQPRSSSLRAQARTTSNAATRWACS